MPTANLTSQGPFAESACVLGNYFGHEWCCLHPEMQGVQWSFDIERGGSLFGKVRHREENQTKRHWSLVCFSTLVFLKFAGTDFCTAGSCPVPQIGCIGEVFGSVDFPRNTSDVQWPASAGREMLAQKRERQTWNILMHFNFLEVTDIVSVDPIKSFLFSESDLQHYWQLV